MHIISNIFSSLLCGLFVRQSQLFRQLRYQNNCFAGHGSKKAAVFKDGTVVMRPILRATIRVVKFRSVNKDATKAELEKKSK